MTAVEEKPKLLAYLDELEKEGKLQKGVDLGVIKGRHKMARIAWHRVQAEMVSTGCTKSVAVQFVADTLGKSETDIWRMLSELK